MKEICEWLKHQVRLAGSPVRDRVRPVAHTPESRQTRRPKTPQSRPTRRYTFELDTPSSEKKRKISWDDILHPFKARRLEKEERKPLHTVRGTFSVTDIQGAKFPGKQTTATSLCAILQSKTLAPSLWTTEVVDRLLLQGDKLHSTRVYHLQKHKSGSTDLKPSELPDKIAVSEREFSLRYSRVSKNRRKRGSGKSNKKTKEEPSNQSRQKKLSTLLKLSLDSTHAGVLLTANKITMGIFVEDAYLYFFHPCKVTNNLFAVNDYEAVLSKFRDTDHLATYLCHKFVKDDSSYNLDVVDFNIEFDMWTEISFSAKMPTV